MNEPSYAEETARIYFGLWGTLSVDLFVALINEGFIVSELEKQWEKERNG